MSRTRRPLIFSIAGHAIVLALPVLLVAEPSLPEPPSRGIDVVLGQSLSQPQAVLIPDRRGDRLILSQTRVSMPASIDDARDATAAVSRGHDGVPDRDFGTIRFSLTR